MSDDNERRLKRRNNFLKTLNASLDDITTIESETAELEVCSAPDEAHYRKIRKLLPPDTEFQASFYPWPVEDHYEDPENWVPEEELGRAWVWQRGFRPPQQSICVAANFLSKFLGNSIETNQSGRYFAINGAVALWALGVNTRPTWSIDVEFICKTFRPLIADLVTNPRFVLPGRLQPINKFSAYSLEMFIRVGPSFGDTSLTQDNLIYTRISNCRIACLSSRHCTQHTTTVHDTTLDIRSLDSYALLKAKLDSYARYSKRRDWEEARDLVPLLPEGSYLPGLNGHCIEVFLNEPPPGLKAPDDWYKVWNDAASSFPGARLGLYIPEPP